MNLSITEEAFVLSSLKEFVKAWAFGSQANFNVESRNGQARLKLEVQLGRPCDPHHHVPPPPLAHQHKGPARRKKDQARAEAHRARQLVSTLSAVSADNSLAAPLVVPTDDDSNPPNNQEEAVQETNCAEQVAVPANEPPADVVEDDPGEDVQVSDGANSVVAAAASVPVQVSSSDPEFVPVFALAAFENCPDEVLTEEYANSLRRYLSSEEHLAQNIVESSFRHESSRTFRNGTFTHTVSVIMNVRTGRLWESPSSYIRKHLGYPNNEWDRSNGTVVKLSRIHQK